MILAWLAALSLISSASTDLTEGQKKHRTRLSKTRLEMPDYLWEECARAWAVYDSWQTEYALVLRDEAREAGEVFDDVVPPGWIITPHWLYYAFLNENRVRGLPREFWIHPGIRTRADVIYHMELEELTPHVVWTGMDATKIVSLPKREVGILRVFASCFENYPPGDIRNGFVTVRAKFKDGRGMSNATAFPFESSGSVRFIPPILESLGPAWTHDDQMVAPYYKGLPFFSKILLSYFVNTNMMRSASEESWISMMTNRIHSVFRFKDPSFFDDIEKSKEVLQRIGRLGRAFASLKARACVGTPLSIYENALALPGSAEEYDRLFGHLPNQGRTSLSKFYRIVEASSPHAIPIEETTRATENYLADSNDTEVKRLLQDVITCLRG